MQLNTSAWNRCTNWKNHGITSSRKYLPDHVYVTASKLTECYICTEYWHYNGVIMSAMASQIIGISIVCSTVCPGADQGKHQSSVSLVFVGEATGDRWRGSQRSVTLKMFPFDNLIMEMLCFLTWIGKSYVHKLIISAQNITVLSHEYHGVSNHELLVQQLNKVCTKQNILALSKRKSVDRIIIGRWTNVEAVAHTLIIPYWANIANIRYRTTSVLKGQYYIKDVISVPV